MLGSASLLRFQGSRAFLFLFLVTTHDNGYQCLGRAVIAGSNAENEAPHRLNALANEVARKEGLTWQPKQARNFLFLLPF